MGQLHRLNSKVNCNNEITTSKTKNENYTLPQGFEPWSPGTKSQCTTNELP